MQKLEVQTEMKPPVVGSPSSRLGRLLLVIAGIILGQAALYGPCLVGTKILLPLDILAQPHTYLPRTETTRQVQQWDPTLCDMVFAFEPARRFAARELRDGRLPLWSPYYFAGAPCIWSIFSPFGLLDCLTESPVIVAWKALVTALLGGIGMYCFCRRALKVGFWPACVCAWCYPVTGFLVIWQGYYVRQTVCLAAGAMVLLLVWTMIARRETQS